MALDPEGGVSDDSGHSDAKIPAPVLMGPAYFGLTFLPSALIAIYVPWFGSQVGWWGSMKELDFAGIVLSLAVVTLLAGVVAAAAIAITVSRRVHRLALDLAAWGIVTGVLPCAALVTVLSIAVQA